MCQIIWTQKLQKLVPALDSEDLIDLHKDRHINEYIQLRSS